MVFEEALTEMKKGKTVKLFDLKYRIRNNRIENTGITHSENFFLNENTKVKDRFDIYPEYIDNTYILSDKWEVVND